MSTITFDKLAYTDKLKSGGVPDEQARVHADALDTALRNTVATKQDVMEIKVEIANVKADILKTLTPLMLGQIAVTVALIKLLWL